MKKVKMILNAAIVLAVVGSAFAFRPFDKGKIFCFADSVLGSINTAAACDAAGQPASTKIDYEVVTSGGSQSDPCPSPSTQTPYNNAVSNACTQTTPGTTRYNTTDL